MLPIATQSKLVNINKTKGIIFRRLKSKVYPLPLVYAGSSIEVVDSFKYLGVELSCSDFLTTAENARAESARKAEWAMSSRCDELGIQDPALRLDLWDAIVKQNMLYGAEVWGSGSLSKDVTGEKIHRAFVRRLLSVPSGYSTMAVLAEIGRYPTRVSAAG